MTMKINDLIIPERISPDFHATSKKRALEELSTLMATSAAGLSKDKIFDSLVGRERLGSTGLGHGVAIPHGRISGRDHAIGAFLRLHEGIDFDAVDGQSVDLLFALLVPDHFTDEHLALLSQLAELFSNKKLCQELRATQDAAHVFDLITHWQAEHDIRSA